MGRGTVDAVGRSGGMIDPVSSRLLRGAGGRGVLVLMYHSIVPGGGRADWPWAVSRERFAHQLDLLRASGWTCCLVRDLEHPADLPARSVVISFDDGYLDNLAGVEELTSRGMIGTWFVVSNDVGGHSRWGDPGQPPRPMLDASHIREMHQAGMEIGAHTRHHVRLPEMDGRRLAEETAGCRQELEDLLGQAVPSFAYPYGLHDDRVVEAVRRAGYRVACTTRSGWGLVGNDPLRVRRIAVFAEDSLSSFARKLAFADHEAGWGKVGRYWFSRLRARFPG